MDAQAFWTERRTLQLSSSSLVFTSQVLNSTSSAQTITLSNAGSTKIAINSIAITGNFAQTNTCGSALAAHASCTLSVTFTPTMIGSATGSLTVTDNASGSPQKVTLSGNGVSAPAPTVNLSATSLAFGNQALSTTSAAQTITQIGRAHV